MDSTNIAKLLYYEYMMVYEVVMYGAQDCVMETVFQGYSTLLSDYNSSSWAVIATVVGYWLTI